MYFVEYITCLKEIKKAILSIPEHFFKFSISVHIKQPRNNRVHKPALYLNSKVPMDPRIHYRDSDSTP